MAKKYVHLYNVFSGISRTFENHCSANPVYRGGSMRFETETFAVYRDGGEDRVSFHLLKGHQNAIVLSLENITGETIRDNCVFWPPCDLP